MVQCATLHNHYYHTPKAIKNRPIQAWAVYFPSSVFLIKLLVRAMNLFTYLITTKTRPLYCGGHFNPLSWEQLTRTLCMLLQLASYDQNSHASYSFRIGAATMAAAAGLPAWLIKRMG